MLKKGDIILILSVVLVAVTMYTVKNVFLNGIKSEQIAVIKQDGKIIKTINLNKVNEPVIVKVTENHVIIKAEKGRIRFIDSMCNDKICVQTGWLSKIGELALCMPLKTEIIITGEQEPDSISY